MDVRAGRGNPRAARKVQLTDLGCDDGADASPATTGVAQIGGPHGVLTEDEIRAFVHDQLAAADLDGRSVCVLVPDGSRSCPLPLLASAIHEVLHGRVSRLTVLVALGTHAAMSEQALAAHLGYQAGALAARYPSMTVLNHAWWDRSDFRRGRDHQRGPDRRAVRWHAAPHRPRAGQPRRGRARRHAHRRARCSRTRSSGFSGGNKYLFPGVSGRELIDLSHWLGALITSAEIIGTRGITPVRALIDEAAVDGARASGSRCAW